MSRFDNAPKRPINLSLNASQNADVLLAVQVRHRWQRWNDDNREAIAAYNERIEREGLTLKKYRTFLKAR